MWFPWQPSLLMTDVARLEFIAVAIPRDATKRLSTIHNRDEAICKYIAGYYNRIKANSFS